MNQALTLRGFVIHTAPPPGTVAVAGPYRPGTEDHWLFAVVNDFRRVGAEPIFVQEQAPKAVGDFVGVTIYRRGIHVETVTVTQAPIEGRGPEEAANRKGQGRRSRRA